MLILCQDFNELLEYIEPANGNLKTYSVRTYELLLRCCTEFESLCKSALKIDKDEWANINTYRPLHVHLETIQVGFSRWQPAPIFIHPFVDWSPPWYRDYNDVKHNRVGNFEKASLENVRNSIAGVFALMHYMKVIPINGQAIKFLETENRVEIIYANPIGMSIKKENRPIID